MDNKELKDAFDEITPPSSLKDRTRAALRYGESTNGRGSHPAAVRSVSRRWTALITALVLVCAVMVPVVGYFGFNSRGNNEGGLRSFLNISEVKSYVAERKGTSSDNWFSDSTGSWATDDGDSSTATEGAAGGDKGNSGGTEHSTTNNQVDGVSESDIVQTDGDYIYLLSYYSLSVIDVRGGALNNVAEIEYDNFYPSEMFLIEGENKLVVLGNFYTESIYYYYDGNGETSVDLAYCYWVHNALGAKVYDLDALTRGEGNAALTREFKFENASLSASRMINGKLYIVMNSYRYYAGDKDGEDNIWIPTYYDSKKGATVELAASDIFATPDNGRSYNYTVVASVDLKADGDAEVKAYFGSTGTLYASKTAFYITYARYEKTTFFGYYKYEYLGLGIMRFEIDGISLKYKGLGTVGGNVLNQFAMDEHTYTDGAHAGGTFFRIATTVGSTESYITVFNEDMKQVGQLGGIGKGERIYSVRFSGVQAVVVTYLQIDPLYVIDLSDPTEPKTKSELKIPGVSDYLHFLKIKDGYVFAVGRSQSSPGALGGVKVSLFDITGDETKEVEYYEVDAGDYSYSSSEATYNHKAIMYFMSQSGEEEIFAFPVNVYGREYKNGSYLYYNISELYYYSVNGSGEMTQTILGYHAEEQDYSDIGGEVYYKYYRDNVRRSVIAGDYIYLIGYSGVERYSRSNLPASADEKGEIVSVGAEY